MKKPKNNSKLVAISFSSTDFLVQPILYFLKMHCRNWPHFCVRSRGWTRRHARVGSPGSACKNAVNSHSTTTIKVVEIKRCNVKPNYPQLNQLQIYAAFPGEYVAMHARWRHNGTECKQNATTSSTHVKNKNFQMNIFHAGLKAWMDLYRQCVCPGSYLKHAFSLSEVKNYNRIRESPWRSWSI